MKKQLGALHKIEYAIIISAIIAATVTIASAFESSLETSHKGLSQRHSEELGKIVLASHQQNDGGAQCTASSPGNSDLGSGDISHSYNEKNLGANGHYKIPDCVTHIAYEAFRDNENIKSVTIPSSVTTIGEWAFAGTTELTSVDIPSSVTTIGEKAFYKTNLTSVNIPPDSSVKTIGEKAFYYNTNLTSVDIPSSVTTIGRYAFAHTKLKSVDIKGDNTTIGDNAFYNALCPSGSFPDRIANSDPSKGGNWINRYNWRQTC